MMILYKTKKEFVTKRFSVKLILKDLLQAKENNPIRKTLSAEGLLSKGNSNVGMQLNKATVGNKNV